MQVTSKGFWGVALVAALILTPLPSTAQTSERVSVVVVDVPVQVTRKGQPVRGLTADDFELFAGGKKVKIASFDVHDVSLSVDAVAHAPGQPTPPPPPPRHFLLLFDLSFSDVGSLQRSQLAAREIVTDSVDPKDLVAVTTYSATTGVRPLLNFTSDRAQILAAIDSMGVNQISGVDPLNLTLVNREDAVQAMRIDDPAATDPKGTGIDMEAEAMEHLAAIQAMVGRQDRRGRAQQVGNMSHDFTKLARLLDSVRARKQVIYLSEGFENDLMTATEDQAAQRDMSGQVEHGRIWEVDTDARFGDTTRQNQFGGMIDELRRADCVVHTIDISTVGGGNLEGRSGSGRLSMGGNQGLSSMASGTGGTYQRNTNQIGQALRNVLLETQVTYMLSFNASKLKQDGAFHKLKVKLTGAAKGAKASHRPGFYAPTPGGSRDPDQMRLALGQRLMAASEGGAIPTEVLTMPFAIDDNNALVPVLMEIDGKSLIGTARAKQVGVQIFAYAVDRRNGDIHDFFSKTIGINVEAAGAAFADTGLKFYGSINLPVGQYDLRLLVVEPTSGRSNLRIVPLEVPEPGVAALMPPLVPDPGGKWLLARIEPPEGQAPAPFPFMADQNPFLPGAHPAVKAGEALRLLLVGRNLGDGEIRAKAALTDAGGQAVATPELSPLRSTRTGMNGYDGVTTALSTDRLAPGEYTLAMTVTAGGESRTSTIPLTVR